MGESDFWGRVVKGEKCWKWLGMVNGRGYGVYFDAGKLEYAHRYAYLLLSGDIAPGERLHNTCQNRQCVNPAHWSTDKPIHNAKSSTKYPKLAKRRYSRRREKVSDAEVAAIHAIAQNTNLTQTAIAKKYRLSQAQVSRILAGLSR